MKKAFLSTATTTIVLGLIGTAASTVPWSAAIAQSRTPAIVVSTGDGDTIRVREGNKTVTVRLSCIDAPEMAQKPFGQQSSARLKQLLPAGIGVQLRTIATDKYGRKVAEIYVGNRSVNLTMVAEGHAVAYRQYLSGCDANQYLTVEADAQLKRLAFWNQSNPVMPWDFRKGGRRSTTKPVRRTVTNPPQNALLACVNSDCNCGDFKTQAEAQRVFNAYPGDPFRLDRDLDGVACESLP